MIGGLTADDLRAAGAALYSLEPVPRDSLWDLSRASLSGFSLDGIRQVQGSLAGLVKGRENGRTAVVAPDDGTFGIVRQYMSMAESLELPMRLMVFRSRAEAVAWLGLPDDFLGGADEPAAPAQL